MGTYVGNTAILTNVTDVALVFAARQLTYIEEYAVTTSIEGIEPIPDRFTADELVATCMDFAQMCREEEHRDIDSAWREYVKRIGHSSRRVERYGRFVNFKDYARAQVVRFGREHEYAQFIEQRAS